MPIRHGDGSALSNLRILSKVLAGVAIVLCVAPHRGTAQIRFSTVYQVGELDAPKAEVFGRNVTPVLAPSGETFLGDWSTGEIRHFDARGRFVRTFGRKGRGPGEFDQITSLALAPTGDTLYAYDANQHRISIFHVSGRFIRAFTPPVRPAGRMRMSFHPAGWFLLTGQVEGNPNLVHVLDRRGRYVRSFARLLSPGDLAGLRGGRRVVQAQLNQGFTQPLPGGDVLVLLEAPYRVGRYSLNGAGRWLVGDRLVGNPVGKMVATPSEYRPGLYPRGTALHILGTDRFLVQYADFENERRGYDVRSIRDGRLLLRHAIPFQNHIATVLPLRPSGGIAILAEFDPFNRYTVSRWELN